VCDDFCFFLKSKQPSLAHPNPEMNQQNVYPQLNSTLKIKGHNCLFFVIIYPRCRSAYIFNQTITDRMRLYTDSLSALPRLNSFTRHITLALALNNFGEGVLKIKSNRLTTRAVPISFRLLLRKIFLIADSCLVYIVDFLGFHQH
jgi:hypothetical protein